MKIRSTFFSLLFAATEFAFLTNCSANKEENTDTTEAHEGHNGHDASHHASDSGTTLEASEPQFQVDEKFQKQLGTVFSAYVELKEAFVASDAKKVQTEASETKDAVAQVDMKLVSGAAHHDWMNYLTSIQESLNEIQSADDIETQRQAFSTLSDNLYKSVKAFGMGGEEAFYEFCPMAFDNAGAYWLSDTKEIRNPYFGDKMLNCGEVKERLQ